jgi:hypothetical protein
MTKWYKLKHRKAIPFRGDIYTSPELFAKESKAFYRSNRRIRRHYFNDVYVSTVFLGLDHSMGLPDSEPLLFETMIFNGELDSHTFRCTTHRQALKQHWQAVNMVKLK